MSIDKAWFVGAMFGAEDQLQRFLSDGIWENGYDDKYHDQVNLIEVGDRIAIKSSFTRKKNLPFDNLNETVSVMKIKAIGTVTANPRDGKRVSVEWKKSFQPKDWYFYTHRGTIWKVEKNSEMNKQLVEFTFEDSKQDYEFFKNEPYWKDRYGGSGQNEITQLVSDIELFQKKFPDFVNFELPGTLYVKEERDYKLDAVQQAKALISDLDLSDAGVIRFIEQLMEVGNFFNWRDKAHIGDMLKKTIVVAALKELLPNVVTGEIEPATFEKIATILKDAGFAANMQKQLLLFLFFIAHPTKYFMIKSSFLDKALARYGYEKLGKGKYLTYQMFQSVQHFASDIFELIAELKPLDMIDIQSFIWKVLSIENGEETDDDDSESEPFTIKAEFIEYLKKKSPEKSGKPSSYARAMEVIEQTFFTSSLVATTDVWAFVTLGNIDSLYEIVLIEQKKEDGVFQGFEPSSYWKNGYCSAALKEFKEFLISKNQSQTAVEKQSFSPINPVSFEILKFFTDLTNSNIKYPPSLPTRFISSLISKPFVILTGLAGSGKTKLAEAFSSWIVEDESTQVCMVAVGADWTNREPLLGYPNALKSGEYVMPDSGILTLLLEAQDNPVRPYFLILDEMNMSHVERYFADFLSAMESDSREIKLHSNETELTTTDGTAVPSKVKLGANLFVIGTVNIDETTYMFSPKVLDRAQVIEFRVSQQEMKEFLENPLPINMGALRGNGSDMGADFVELAKSAKNKKEKDLSALSSFFEQLQSVGAEFGYRTASEIATFIAVCKELADGSMSESEIVDAAIMQKLLPKVHGSRNRIASKLELLAKLCLLKSEENPFTVTDEDKIKFKLSFEKLKRMHDRVIKDGFTSFAEA